MDKVYLLVFVHENGKADVGGVYADKQEAETVADFWMDKKRTDGEAATFLFCHVAERPFHQ